MSTARQVPQLEARVDDVRGLWLKSRNGKYVIGHPDLSYPTPAFYAKTGSLWRHSRQKGSRARLEFLSGIRSDRQVLQSTKYSTVTVDKGIAEAARIDAEL